MRRQLLITALLLLTVAGLAWGTGTLSVPNVFTNVTGNQPAANLDANFTAIQNYVNNRELVVGLLANRPAAAYNGRTYFATDVAGGTLYVDDGSTWRATTATPAVRSYLAGCTLSNDGVSPNTVIDVAAGVATSDDQTTSMTLAAITGSTAGTWVVGTGQNKLDAGAVAINTWYHVYVIERTDTAVVDVLYSTNASAPTMPANYTKKRRVGSFKTATGTTNILAFTQDGDYFRWAASILDLNATNPGTAAVTRTLTTPLGVATFALLNVNVHQGSSGVTFAYLSDLAANDEAPSTSVGPLASTPSILPSGALADTFAFLAVRTNTASQIRTRLNNSDANTFFFLATLGWIDRRGRDT